MVLFDEWLDNRHGSFMGFSASSILEEMNYGEYKHQRDIYYNYLQKQITAKFKFEQYKTLHEFKDAIIGSGFYDKDVVFSFDDEVQSLDMEFGEVVFYFNLEITKNITVLSVDWMYSI